MEFRPYIAANRHAAVYSSCEQSLLFATMRVVPFTGSSSPVILVRLHPLPCQSTDRDTHPYMVGSAGCASLHLSTLT